MRRDVIHAEAIAWLDANAAAKGTSVVTSLPDVSEMRLGFDQWRAWFIATARRLVRWVPDDGVAIFFQSDVLHRGSWVDKGHLVACAADEERASLVFHKIVCRKPAGTLTQGRASYSHLVCVSRSPRPPRHPSADVIPRAGAMSWSKAMGEDACAAACAYLRDETETRTVVDPFCGRGSVLAVANAMGFDAIGIDIASSRCRAARSAVVS